MSKMEKLSSEKFDEITNVVGKVVVKFGAKWCGPCKMLNPQLDKLAETVSVYDVDVDENQDLAKKFGIRNVPTTIVFVNGVSKATKVGMVNLEVLKSLVESV